MSFDRLQDKIDKMRNPTVVGLDPALKYIPPNMLKRYIASNGDTLEAAAAAVFEFSQGIIDALCDIVPAVKPQSAYYEALGPEGVLVLKKTCDYAKSRGMYVICDGKRNDIGTTAEAYSAAYLGSVKVGGAELRPFDVDALTVNAYFGSDGIKPFIETAVKYDKAIFALVKTSNPSSGELQDLFVQRRDISHKGGNFADVSAAVVEFSASRVYTAVGDLMEEISRYTAGKYGYSRVGAVIGATYPDEIKMLRARLENTFFLVPGYGAQGGTADNAALAFDKNGRGAVVNSSRGIIAAWTKTNKGYTFAARDEALRMREELRAAIRI